MPLVVMALVRTKELVLVLALVPRMLAMKDWLVAPTVTADKSIPPLLMVTESLPEFPTSKIPAKFTRVFRSRVMVSVLPLMMLIPEIPVEGAVESVPMVAAVIVSVFATAL